MATHNSIPWQHLCHLHFQHICYHRNSEYHIRRQYLYYHLKALVDNLGN